MIMVPGSSRFTRTRVTSKRSDVTQCIELFEQLTPTQRSTILCAMRGTVGANKNEKPLRAAMRDAARSTLPVHEGGMA